MCTVGGLVREKACVLGWCRRETLTEVLPSPAVGAAESPGLLGAAWRRTVSAHRNSSEILKREMHLSVIRWVAEGYQAGRRASWLGQKVAC